MPLTVPQWANGQTVTETSIQYFTSNSVTTFYSAIESTSTSKLPLHYESTPFGYSNQTDSFFLNQMDTIPVRMSFGWEDYPCLYYDYFLFKAAAGHEIRGHFELTETGRSIHFFILSSSQLRHFGNCGNGKWSWDVHVFASSYDFDWIVPKSDAYAFLFLSREFYGSSIHITAQDYSTTLQSSMETFTNATTYTVQSNQIVLSTLTRLSLQPSSMEYYYASFILIVIVALILSFIILRMKRLR
jgi:hypothetical protein